MQRGSSPTVIIWRIENISSFSVVPGRFDPLLQGPPVPRHPGRAQGLGVHGAHGGAAAEPAVLAGGQGRAGGGQDGVGEDAGLRHPAAGEALHAQVGIFKPKATFFDDLTQPLHFRWSKLDGLGALVITPTRELAYQIFDQVRAVGRHHDFSAGLVIGGKDLKFESGRMAGCNIVICTPGRLLQHMDENPQFNASSLQVRERESIMLQTLATNYNSFRCWCLMKPTAAWKWVSPSS